MQEEVENKTVTLAITSTKFTGRTLKNAITKLLASMNRQHRQHKQAKAEVIPHGKQTVKELVKQNQGVSSMEVADKDMKEFERIARKYGVDYAVKKGKGKNQQYLVFFKARDSDALIAAFKEFTQKKEHKKDHPSIIKRLFQARVPGMEKDRDLVKNKKKEISR